MIKTIATNTKLAESNVKKVLEEFIKHEINTICQSREIEQYLKEVAESAGIDFWCETCEGSGYYYTHGCEPYDTKNYCNDCDGKGKVFLP